MISLARPSSEKLARFATLAADLEPAYPAPGRFHEFAHEGVVGRGPSALSAGADALRAWKMHGGAGVTATPTPLEAGETVTMHARTLGLWLVFACRITKIHDGAREFGFTYATLPGHPEQGEESFVLHHLDNDDVVLRVAATSRPAILLSKLSGPVGRLLQRRYAKGYVDAVEAAVRSSVGS